MWTANFDSRSIDRTIFKTKINNTIMKEIDKNKRIYLVLFPRLANPSAPKIQSPVSVYASRQELEKLFGRPSSNENGYYGWYIGFKYETIDGETELFTCMVYDDYRYDTNGFTHWYWRLTSSSESKAIFASVMLNEYIDSKGNTDINIIK